MARLGSSIKTASEDRALYRVVNIALALFFLIVAYPLIYIISSSFSSSKAVASGRVLLWPVDFSLDGYKAALDYRSVMTGYRATIIYTITGTFVNVMMTLFAAFPLSRKNFQGRKFFMTLFVITMFFSGGLIPAYLLIVQLKLINTIWAIIIPGAISTYNLIITRTFFMNSIPGDIVEAAQIDGCGDIRFFFTMLLPLSKPIVAVITLYYGVGHWNSWFSAMLYIRDTDWLPLQLALRAILTGISTIDPSMFQSADPELIERMQYMQDLMKYSLIVIASAPIIAVYPFLQRYFIKGVMIGSLKG